MGRIHEVHQTTGYIVAVICDIYYTLGMKQRVATTAEFVVRPGVVWLFVLTLLRPLARCSRPRELLRHGQTRVSMFGRNSIK